MKKLERFEKELLKLFTPSDKWDKDSFYNTHIYFWSWNNNKYCASTSMAHKRLISFVVSVYNDDDTDRTLYIGKDMQKCLQVVKDLCKK